MASQIAECEAGTERRKRIKRLLRVMVSCLGVLTVGVMYGVFVKTTGYAVPCMFYRITGLKCPGCGVTKMCVALLGMKWCEAFESHPMLFLQLPVLGLIVLKNAVSYVKKGAWRVSRMETVIIYICIVLLLVFAVIRNLIA